MILGSQRIFEPWRILSPEYIRAVEDIKPLERISAMEDIRYVEDIMWAVRTLGCLKSSILSLSLSQAVRLTPSPYKRRSFIKVLLIYLRGSENDFWIITRKVCLEFKFECYNDSIV